VLWLWRGLTELGEKAIAFPTRAIDSNAVVIRVMLFDLDL
jgi:hypothetical protein